MAAAIDGLDPSVICGRVKSADWKDGAMDGSSAEKLTSVAKSRGRLLGKLRLERSPITG
jgi:hypothetical protein